MLLASCQWSCAVPCFLEQWCESGANGGRESWRKGLGADRANHTNMACVQGTSVLDCRHMQDCWAPLPPRRLFVAYAKRTQPTAFASARAEGVADARYVRLQKQATEATWQRQQLLTRRMRQGARRDCVCRGTWSGGKDRAEEHAAADLMLSDNILC